MSIGIVAVQTGRRERLVDCAKFNSELHRVGMAGVPTRNIDAFKPAAVR